MPPTVYDNTNPIFNILTGGLWIRKRLLDVPLRTINHEENIVILDEEIKASHGPENTFVLNRSDVVLKQPEIDPEEDQIVYDSYIRDISGAKSDQLTCATGYTPLSCPSYTDCFTKCERDNQQWWIFIGGPGAEAGLLAYCSTKCGIEVQSGCQGGCSDEYIPSNTFKTDFIGSKTKPDLYDNVPAFCQRGPEKISGCLSSVFIENEFDKIPSYCYQGEIIDGSVGIGNGRSTSQVGIGSNLNDKFGPQKNAEDCKALCASTPECKNYAVYNGTNCFLGKHCSSEQDPTKFEIEKDDDGNNLNPYDLLVNKDNAVANTFWKQSVCDADVTEFNDATANVNMTVYFDFFSNVEDDFVLQTGNYDSLRVFMDSIVNEVDPVDNIINHNQNFITLAENTLVNAVISDFYNSLYLTGYYGKDDNRNRDLFNSINKIRSEGITPWQVVPDVLYEDSFFMSSLDNLYGLESDFNRVKADYYLYQLLEDILILPSPKSNAVTEQNIKLRISPRQYQELTKSGVNSRSYVNNCFANFLGDAFTSVQSPYKNNAVIPVVDLMFEGNNSKPMVILLGIDTAKPSYVTQQTDQNRYILDSIELPIGGTVELIQQIQLRHNSMTIAWIIVGYEYSLRSNNKSETPGLYKLFKQASPIGQFPGFETRCNDFLLDNSAFGGLVPSECQTFYCTPDPVTGEIDEKCKSVYQTGCSAMFTNPTTAQFMGNDVDDYLFRWRAENACNCVGTRIPPNFNASNTNWQKIGMCFDVKCENPIGGTPLPYDVDVLKRIFGVTPEFCSEQQTCSEIASWVDPKNSNTINQSGNMQDIDSGVLKDKCGITFNAYYDKPYNYKVLIAGLLLSAFLGWTSWVFFKNKKILITTIIILVTVGLSIFLMFDFGGEAYCPDNLFGESYCRSRITKIRIPKEFCSYELSCECLAQTNQGQDARNCDDSCYCTGTGLCVPKNGVRKESSSIQISTKPMIFVFVSLILILLPFTVYYSITYFGKDPKLKLLYYILIGIGLLIIANVSIYFILKLVGGESKPDLSLKCDKSNTICPDCPEGQILVDGEMCRCGCSGSRVLNADFQCVCPLTLPTNNLGKLCTESGGVVDPTSCECKCDTNATYNLVQSADFTRCVCPEGAFGAPFCRCPVCPNGNQPRLLNGTCNCDCDILGSNCTCSIQGEKPCGDDALAECCSPDNCLPNADNTKFSCCPPDRRFVNGDGNQDCCAPGTVVNADGICVVPCGEVLCDDASKCVSVTGLSSTDIEAVRSQILPANWGGTLADGTGIQYCQLPNECVWETNSHLPMIPGNSGDSYPGYYKLNPNASGPTAFCRDKFGADIQTPNKLFCYVKQSDTDCDNYTDGNGQKPCKWSTSVNLPKEMEEISQSFPGTTAIELTKDVIGKYSTVNSFSSLGYYCNAFQDNNMWSLDSVYEDKTSGNGSNCTINDCIARISTANAVEVSFDKTTGICSSITTPNPLVPIKSSDEVPLEVTADAWKFEDCVQVSTATVNTTNPVLYTQTGKIGNCPFLPESQFTNTVVIDDNGLAYSNRSSANRTCLWDGSVREFDNTCGIGNLSSVRVTVDRCVTKRINYLVGIYGNSIKKSTSEYDYTNNTNVGSCPSKYVGNCFSSLDSLLDTNSQIITDRLCDSIYFGGLLFVATADYASPTSKVYLNIFDNTTCISRQEITTMGVNDSLAKFLLVNDTLFLYNNNIISYRTVTNPLWVDLEAPPTTPTGATHTLTLQFRSLSVVYGILKDVNGTPTVVNTLFCQIKGLQNSTSFTGSYIYYTDLPVYNSTQTWTNPVWSRIGETTTTNFINGLNDRIFINTKDQTLYYATGGNLYFTNIQNNQNFTNPFLQSFPYSNVNTRGYFSYDDIVFLFFPDVVYSSSATDPANSAIVFSQDSFVNDKRLVNIEVGVSDNFKIKGMLHVRIPETTPATNRVFIVGENSNQDNLVYFADEIDDNGKRGFTTFRKSYSTGQTTSLPSKTYKIISNI